MAAGLESELVKTTLESGHIWGAITVVLLTTILSLVGYILTLHKKADKVYGYRLAERDTLQIALSEAKNAASDMAAASRERNALTEELAQVIAQSNAQTITLNALLKLQFEFLKDEHSRLHTVVGAMSESARNINSNVQKIDGVVTSLPTMITAVQSHFDKTVHELLPPSRRTR